VLRFPADGVEWAVAARAQNDPRDRSNELAGVDTCSDSPQDHRLVPIAGSNGINEEAMMHVVRVAALVAALATGTGWSGAAAQTSGFTCEDFLTQSAAEHSLENTPSDPYDLDPDGDGLACEEMQTNGNAEAGSAPDANAVEERPASNNDGADADVDVPQVTSQNTQAESNAEERGSLDEIKSIMQPVGDGLIQVGERFHIPRLVDASLVADVAHQFVFWQSSLDDAVALQPPPAFVDIHSLYAGCLSLIVDASDDIAGGLDTSEVALANVIDQARGLIEVLVSKRGR
jgi:hypothetical protein